MMDIRHGIISMPRSRISGINPKSHSEEIMVDTIEVYFITKYAFDSETKLFV